MPVVKQTMEMLAKSDLPGPLRTLSAHAAQGGERGLREAQQAHLRQRQGLGPLRHHPDPAGADQPERDRSQALRHGRQTLPRGVLPAGRVHGHDPHLDREGRGQGPHLPDQWQGARQAGLAGGVRQGSAGRRREPRRGGPGRNGAHRRRGGECAEDQTPRALHRGHLARRDGRRRQADRRRRAARSDAGEGPGHAGHARGHHRRPDLREVHAPRRPRTGAGRQGLSADDAAARAWVSKT